MNRLTNEDEQKIVATRKKNMKRKTFTIPWNKYEWIAMHVVEKSVKNGTNKHFKTVVFV